MKRASPLLAALSAERAALQKFVALLESEQGLLMESQTDQLLELSEQKSRAALELNNLAEARRALLKQHLPQLTVDAIRDWMEAHSREGLFDWQEILSLAERAQLLNNANGAVIQMKLRHNQQALAVLNGAVNKANLYGPDGQPSFAPGSGRSLGSG
ncbi:MAG TPA: flagellar protein FlgN [Gallionella sp.]|nr:flagellar protein FlgN [Gallionella sp.]